VSVNLETYIFQPDAAGRQFADAMNRGGEAGRRGPASDRRLRKHSWETSRSVEAGGRKGCGSIGRSA